MNNSISNYDAYSLSLKLNFKDKICLQGLGLPKYSEWEENILFGCFFFFAAEQTVWKINPQFQTRLRLVLPDQDREKSKRFC